MRNNSYRFRVKELRQFLETEKQNMIQQLEKEIYKSETENQTADEPIELEVMLVFFC